MIGKLEYWLGAKFVPIPQILHNGSRIVHHFLCRGALLGLNQKLDPDHITPKKAITLTALALLVVLFLVSHGTVRIGMAMVMCSPVWLYAFAKIPDVVMENRTYLTLTGLAFIAAAAAEQTFWPVMFLAAVYTATTLDRNRYWATRFAFWQKASIESPLNHRPKINYAVALSKMNRIQEAVDIYRAVVDSGSNSRVAGLAASNLSLIYLHEHGRTNDHRWVQLAALVLHEAETRWPHNPRIRFNRGLMFQGFGRWPEAIREFSIAVEHHPDYADAWRERARCYGRLGKKDEAQADADQAERIDGIRGVLRFHAHGEEGVT